MPIVTFFQERPLFFFALLFFIYNKWKGSQPWPDYGGNITKVHNLQEWDSLLKSSGSSKVVVVDAYALWCPPCKSAAPVYAKLSEEFSEETCCFAKIDVDHAKDVAQRLQISAMPTFKVHVSAHRGRAHTRCPALLSLRSTTLPLDCISRSTCYLASLSPSLPPSLLLSQFFKDGKEVGAQQGWCGEAKMRELCASHGAKPAKKD